MKLAHDSCKDKVNMENSALYTYAEISQCNTPLSLSLCLGSVEHVRVRCRQGNFRLSDGRNELLLSFTELHFTGETATEETGNN